MPLKKNPDGERRVTLKMIAEHLGLATGTVSAALNNSAAARTIPEHTKQKIQDAARELNYQPNFFARSLRLQRTYTIGVITEQIGDPYGAVVISGIEEALRDTEYLFLTVVHRHDPKVLQNYSRMLTSRGVEGFITVDTSIEEEPALPTVAIAGHHTVPKVTNLILDQKHAARLALTHLLELGHREIAFMKGQPTSSDAATRWASICSVCEELNICIRPELTVQIQDDLATPQLGYPFAKELIARGHHFTAIFAYNDLSAIGAIWALQDAGIRVPDDVSVVGVDDVPIASFSNPALTTVRQPLEQMGRIAARTLIERIENRCEFRPEIVIEPELVVRASSGPVSAGRRLPNPASL
jgi:DNA-binding LacI/PurR family transcriptional regulator